MMMREDLKRFDIPDAPGVYFFTRKSGKKNEVLYIGKATSLRDRVRSYFDDDLIATRGPVIVDMITRSEAVSFEITTTVLEALVREAALIKEHQPYANVKGKDEKSFLYVGITKEDVPRVLMVRGKDINFLHKTAEGMQFKNFYGPFPSGRELKEGLRLMRKIFPFYDTPKPITENGKYGRARIEFNTQIGLYPYNVDKSAYARSIANIELFLSGKVKMLRERLKKKMKESAKTLNFEKAKEYRNQLYALDHIQDVSLIMRDEKVEEGRVEAYDTAHIRGTHTIGVMVVFTDGKPEPKEYRSFIIRNAKTKNELQNDLASLKEIIIRRFGHSEWRYPSALVVDGGRVHKKTAEEVLASMEIHIPVIAVVKNEKHRPKEVIGTRNTSVSESTAILINGEAHRFALKKHRAARSRAISS